MCFSHGVNTGLSSLHSAELLTAGSQFPPGWCSERSLQEGGGLGPGSLPLNSHWLCALGPVVWPLRWKCFSLLPVRLLCCVIRGLCTSSEMTGAGVGGVNATAPAPGYSFPHYLHPASPSSCQVGRRLYQDRRDPDPTGKGEECCSISGGTWTAGWAQPVSSSPHKLVSHQPWLFVSASDFLPTLEKEKLPRLFKDFPDFKNRHSSEHKSPGGWAPHPYPRTGVGHLAAGSLPASPQRRGLLRGICSTIHVTFSRKLQAARHEGP